jgi:hypothetical protein
VLSRHATAVMGALHSAGQHVWTSQGSHRTTPTRRDDASSFAERIERSMQPKRSRIRCMSPLPTSWLVLRITFSMMKLTTVSIAPPRQWVAFVTDKVGHSHYGASDLVATQPLSRANCRKATPRCGDFLRVSCDDLALWSASREGVGESPFRTLAPRG